MRCHLVLHRPPRSLTFLLCVRLFSCLMKTHIHHSFSFFAHQRVLLFGSAFFRLPHLLPSHAGLSALSPCSASFPFSFRRCGTFLCHCGIGMEKKKKTATAKANRMKLRERERRKEKKRKRRDQLRRVQQWCALLAGRQRNCCTWAPQPTESCPADACRP